MADGVVVVGGRFRGDRLGISDMRERDTNFLRNGGPPAGYVTSHQQTTLNLIEFKLKTTEGLFLSLPYKDTS
jgi:hypothetical protein